MQEIDLETERIALRDGLLARNASARVRALARRFEAYRYLASEHVTPPSREDESLAKGWHPGDTARRDSAVR